MACPRLAAPRQPSLHGRAFEGRPARSALWEACWQRAADVGGGCEARLVRERVASLAELDALHGPHDAVIVAAGAAVGALPELRASRAVQLK